jgi:two-component system response regulator AgrA
MLSIAILDDNEKILREYERLIPELLKRNKIDGNIIISTSSYKEFLKKVKEQLVNVCIIDINLQDEVNGFYIAKYIRREKIRTEIIFLTGMLDYMSQAFDVGAYNFLPKPINNSLEKCLVRLSKELDERDNSKNTIMIRYGSRIFFVPIDSITHIQREGRKTIIYTTCRILETYDSLESITRRINDDRFIQCHRSAFVNRDFIEYVDLKARAVKLTTKGQIDIGSKYYSGFIKDISDTCMV